MRLVLTIIMMAVFTIPALSQDSDAKRINLIKLDDAYYYGDVRMSAKEMAREAARVELLTQANNLRREEGLSSIGEGDVEGIQYILSTTRRGDIRCFGYILRSDVGKPKAQALTPAPDAIGSPAAAAAAAPEVAQKPAASSSSDDAVVDELTAKFTGIVDEATKDMDPLDELKTAGALLMGLEYFLLMDDDVDAVAAPSRTEAAKVTAGKLVPWQIDAVEEIMEQPDFDHAMRLLNRFRTLRKISGYGAPNKCPSERSSFWVMFDGDDCPVTVIGPEKGGGYIDLLTGDPTDLKTYAGNTAVWFQFRR